ncbi:hypothetical protein ACOTCQ_31900, partial [Achromobacter dolens]|uniref:hypothetical protein n=1 Tax=Achromobacter dolens TaxID=1287738 RepID=UPI003B9B7333
RRLWVNMKNILETADRLFIRDVFHLGLVVAAVGGYSAGASQLNIRPFERAPYPAGWLADRNGGLARGKDEQE